MVLYISIVLIISKNPGRNSVGDSFLRKFEWSDHMHFLLFFYIYFTVTLQNSMIIKQTIAITIVIKCTSLYTLCSYHVLPSLASRTECNSFDRIRYSVLAACFVFSNKASRLCKFVWDLVWTTFECTQSGSVMMRSGDCDGHSRTFAFFPAAATKGLTLCFGSLSCWKI